MDLVIYKNRTNSIPDRTSRINAVLHPKLLIDILDWEDTDTLKYWKEVYRHDINEVFTTPLFKHLDPKVYSQDVWDAATKELLWLASWQYNPYHRIHAEIKSDQEKEYINQMYTEFGVDDEMVVDAAAIIEKHITSYIGPVQFWEKIWFHLPEEPPIFSLYIYQSIDHYSKKNRILVGEEDILRSSYPFSVWWWRFDSTAKNPARYKALAYFQERGQWEMIYRLIEDVLEKRFYYENEGVVNMSASKIGSKSDGNSLLKLALEHEYFEDIRNAPRKHRNLLLGLFFMIYNSLFNSMFQPPVMSTKDYMNPQ